VLDKAKYSAFESTLNSTIVSFRNYSTDKKDVFWEDTVCITDNKSAGSDNT